ncbi:MAG: DNA repair exonuclease [Aminobacterium sp.]|jgi:exonuclease SbcD|uniref:metallophosphoesterase family protein n=1 Tax=Aminobacterium sp. MB27-C1 TaxID=3070661 RepID=UPI001BCB97CD|nr:DNA repair exonuclease [Aminobacterium sp. MB27-C1]MDD2206689.1 DNA repair exonuclease [Aminobacterium sp.]MDD3425316.1 DNA repair exonuclease [Aminobacterium sp.]MDD3706893.1 DNA repair exonuclease [Aminobacterium sp.]MDD4228851.1 DNA repair exonuclease [Aminobacterium sp.]MDD4551048.1 DNA repair exonuclease [Aminobacterium sp.]
MGLQQDFTFLHCADLHLDSPFRGIRSYSPVIAQKLSKAVFRSFERIIDLALQEKVDFVLLAGDLYDSADRSLSAQIALREQLVRLSYAGISAYIVHGNHDPLNGDQAKLALPDKVFRFKNEVEVFPLQTKDGLNIGNIIGYSYPESEENKNIARKMAESIQGAEGFNIALLHCNAGGIQDYANYAPCVLDDLRQSSIDYWALGHIHRPLVISRQDPVVVYPGTIQGRSIRETGAHGCYLVKVSAGRAIQSIFCPTDQIRWEEEEIDTSHLESDQDIFEALHALREKHRTIAEKRGIMLRVTLTGNTSLSRRLSREGYLEEMAEELNKTEETLSDFVWFERIQNRVHPLYPIENMRKTESFIGDFIREMDTFKSECCGRENFFSVIDEALGTTRWRGRELDSFLEELSAEEIREIVEKAMVQGLDGLLQGEDNLLCDL